MKKLIGKVQCDECDWTKDKVNIFDWHNKKCPKCKNSIIVNDEEIKIANAVLKLESLGHIALTNNKDTDSSKFVKATINTSSLRK